MSVVRYSTDYVIEWGLEGGNTTAMNEKIIALQQFSGSTNTYTAIEGILTDEANDIYPGRRNDYPLVLIVVTDGRAKVYIV